MERDTEDPGALTSPAAGRLVTPTRPPKDSRAVQRRSQITLAQSEAQTPQELSCHPPGWQGVKERKRTRVNVTDEETESQKAGHPLKVTKLVSRWLRA